MNLKQNKARKRNWSKRIITGHTQALKTTLKDGELTQNEKNSIITVCSICDSLLLNWPKINNEIK